MKHKQHIYHRDNCISMIRDNFRKDNISIVLSGKHAFEYQISICFMVHSTPTCITTTKYENGNKARKAFNELKNKYK